LPRSRRRNSGNSGDSELNSFTQRVCRRLPVSWDVICPTGFSRHGLSSPLRNNISLSPLGRNTSYFAPSRPTSRSENSWLGCLTIESEIHAPWPCYPASFAEKCLSKFPGKYCFYKWLRQIAATRAPVNAPVSTGRGRGMARYNQNMNVDDPYSRKFAVCAEVRGRVRRLQAARSPEMRPSGRFSRDENNRHSVLRDSPALSGCPGRLPRPCWRATKPEGRDRSGEPH
jgi:hypothetical protein